MQLQAAGGSAGANGPGLASLAWLEVSAGCRLDLLSPAGLPGISHLVAQGSQQEERASPVTLQRLLLALGCPYPVQGAQAVARAVYWGAFPAAVCHTSAELVCRLGNHSLSHIWCEPS